MITREDFVWFAPKNQFYFVPTRERWVKSGVTVDIGKEGIAWVMKERAALSYQHLQTLMDELSKT
jgi:hypothetical protein